MDKEHFLLPVINTKRLRGKTLSIFWQEIAKCTITTCSCKFESSSKKQMRDFLKDQTELVSRFSQKANQALEEQLEILVTEVKSAVWRRHEQENDLRTEHSLSSTTLGRLVATTKSRTRWSTSALDSFGSGNTPLLRGCSKILELLSRLLDQKLIDFDKEKRNFYEKYDATDNTVFSEQLG